MRRKRTTISQEIIASTLLACGALAPACSRGEVAPESAPATDPRPRDATTEPVAGSERKQPDFPILTVVVPDGYRGEFWVESDESQGDPIPRVSGEYVLTIPDSGKLKVRSLEPLSTWHTERHRFASGGELIQADEGDHTIAKLAPDDVRIWGYAISAVQSPKGQLHRTVWFVGTYAQLRAWKKWRLDFPDRWDEEPQGWVRSAPR